MNFHVGWCQGNSASRRPPETKLGTRLEAPEEEPTHSSEPKGDVILGTIGVLFGCLAGKIDGDSWFPWWYFLIYQGYPSTSPKRTPTLGTLFVIQERFLLHGAVISVAQSWKKGSYIDPAKCV